jgi:hypothetical protein
MRLKRIQRMVDDGTIRQTLERGCNTMDDADDIAALIQIGIENYNPQEHGA